MQSTAKMVVVAVVLVVVVVVRKRLFEHERRGDVRANDTPNPSAPCVQKTSTVAKPPHSGLTRTKPQRCGEKEEYSATPKQALNPPPHLPYRPYQPWGITPAARAGLRQLRAVMVAYTGLRARETSQSRTTHHIESNQAKEQHPRQAGRHSHERAGGHSNGPCR